MRTNINKIERMKSIKGTSVPFKISSSISNSFKPSRGSSDGIVLSSGTSSGSSFESYSVTTYFPTKK